jgi:LacI family transcriptional regulator
MAKFVPAGSRVAVTTGMLQIEHHSRRVNAFAEAFSEFSPGGAIVAVVEDHEDEREAFEKCAALLCRGDDLRGLYVSTANCLPVCAALEAARLGGKVRLITSDVFPQMVPHFEDGTICASIHQRPHAQGQTAVRLIVDHFLHGVPFPPLHLLAPNIALLSNLRLFREVRSGLGTESPPARHEWAEGVSPRSLEPNLASPGDGGRG